MNKINFTQWQEHINDLRTKFPDFQKQAVFELEGQDFLVSFDGSGSFKTELDMNKEELEKVKQFIEASDNIFNKEVEDARYRAVNKNLSKMKP